MPLLEVLRALNAASLYWNNEPMDLGVILLPPADMGDE